MMYLSKLLQYGRYYLSSHYNLKYNTTFILIELFLPHRDSLNE